MKKRKTHSFLKRSLAMLVTGAMLMPGGFTAFANEAQDNEDPKAALHEELSRYINALTPVEKKGNKKNSSGSLLKSSGTSGTLPSSYRSDEEAWAKGVKVKDQRSTGLCWAYSATTAAEYSYAKEINDTEGNIAELSPGHLGYFFHYRVVDPLGLTVGDGTNYADNYEWPIIGGNLYYGMQHLATWSGLASEETAPTDPINDYIYDDDWNTTWDYRNWPAYDDALAYQDELILQEGIMLVAPDIDTVKQYIWKYGAVSASLCMEQEVFVNEDNNAFYDFEGGSNNHAVTVIGWDDSFPKENFTHTTDIYGDQMFYRGKFLSESEAAQLTTPPDDGAWVVQNSWGDYYDNGIFYVSYYSPDIANNNKVYVLDMQSADTYRYNFQYDGTWGIGDATDPGNEAFRTVGGTRAANIYENITEGAITVDGVGFATYDDGLSHYTVKVYTDLVDPDDPESGTCVSTTTFTTETMGTKTVELKEKAYVKKGGLFSVVFTFSDEVNAFCVEQERDDFSDIVAEIDPHQSFFRPANSNKWKDMYQYDACFRIKALANPAEDPEPKPAVPVAEKPIYNGNAQELVSVDTDDIMVYSLGVDDVNEPTSGWGEAIPTGTDAGDYYVWYRDTSFDESEAGCIKVTVKQKEATVTAADQTVYINEQIDTSVGMATLSGAAPGHTLDAVTLISSSTSQATGRGTITPADAVIKNGEADVTANYSITYIEGRLTVKRKSSPTPVEPDESDEPDEPDEPEEPVIQYAYVKVAPRAAQNLYYDGSLHALVTGGSAFGGAMKYALGTDSRKVPADSQFSTVIPSAKEAGTYYVWYKVFGNEGYTDSDAGCVTVTITKRYSKEWVNGKWYNADGSQTYRPMGSWKKNNTGKYYIDTAGWYPKNGWMKIDGIWYYFDARGYLEVNSYRGGFYITASGAWDGKDKAIGWKQVSGKWQFLKADGTPLNNGWMLIDGKLYYFHTNGFAAQNEFVQGKWLSANCAQTYKPIGSWHRTASGKWWYGDTSGWYAKNGYVTIDGVRYRFDAWGFLMEN